jgi:beta-mannan synthase
MADVLAASHRLLQVLGKAYRTIWCSKNVGFWRKANCYWFFTRYVLFAIVTFAILLVPPAVLFFETWTWAWEQIFFMIAVNFAMAVYLYMTPFSIAYLAFSISVGYFKTWAMMCGLFGSKKSRSWKVTAKLGATALFKRKFHKPYFMELVLFLYYGGFAGLAFWMANWMFGGYCAIMALIFLAVSLGDYYM